MTDNSYDAVIIGGGIVGCSLALHLKKSCDKVLILEREGDILQRASYANQARVHNGYHYPRSILTALRSRVNFPRFVDDYRDCVDQSFDKYYAIEKHSSKVTASQFKTFCARIGASIKLASKEVKKLFNVDLIEDVFLVKEYAFDAVKLKHKLAANLKAQGVELSVDCNVTKIVAAASGSNLQLSYSTKERTAEIRAKQVFNCTYSQLNQILATSHLSVIPLKHELAEIALVDVPAHLKNVGVTVMDGPFFSLMPFPARGLHSLSHVRYTPHHSWQDREAVNYLDGNKHLEGVSRKSNYVHMIKDAERYMPTLRHCRHVTSLWEVKTVLPSSEVDDSRPILFRKDPALKNLICILGGKIDNIYEVFDEVDTLRVGGDL